MGQERCVLPVQCKRCGTIFDLWYDLHQSEINEGVNYEENTALNKAAKQSFCWRCRQTIVEKLMQRTQGEEQEDEWVFEI